MTVDKVKVCRGLDIQGKLFSGKMTVDGKECYCNFVAITLPTTSLPAGRGRGTWPLVNRPLKSSKNKLTIALSYGRHLNKYLTSFNNLSGYGPTNL